MRLFVSAGEASGDAYGAEIVKRVRALVPSVEVEAVGGLKLAESEARIVASSLNWGAMGVVASLSVTPRVCRGAIKVVQNLREGVPGLFLPIDFGTMNVRMAREAKRRGWKVLYFIPPGSWRRDRQGRSIPEVSDEIVTPFPWSQEIFTRMGAKAHYFGHPLLDMIQGAPDQPARNGLALLPGSRIQEVRTNLTAIVGALLLMGSHPPVTVGLAPNVSEEEAHAWWKKLNGPPVTFTRAIHSLLKGSEAAIICSGTATLEGALCGCPMVVVYRLSPLLLAEARILRPKFDFAALPNILLSRGAFPELLGDAAEPGAIKDNLLPLLTDTPERRAQLSAIQEVKDLAGSPGCLDKTAQRAAFLLALA
jgi:lipid-A-disaccharide synthase